MNVPFFTKQVLTTNPDDADILFIVDVANFAFRQAMTHKSTDKAFTVQSGELKGKPSGHIYGFIQSLSCKLRDFAV